MTSVAHQWLLLWAARKMTADAYILAGFDGPTPQGGVWNALPRPFELAHVRPDAWGVHVETCCIAAGEAKTAADLRTEHTRRQLCVLGRLRRRIGGDACRLYIAVPRSAATALDCALKAVGLLGARHVVRLHIPDCLVKEVPHGFE